MLINQNIKDKLTMRSKKKIITNIAGGRLSEMFSAKWVMFFSVFINVVCTILTPIMATWHYIAVVAMRIGEGIGGVSFQIFHYYNFARNYYINVKCIDSR